MRAEILIDKSRGRNALEGRGLFEFPAVEIANDICARAHRRGKV